MRDAAYANTEVRQRYLWVEFDKPLLNPRDAYFGRITAYAPDPLLAEWTEDWMTPRSPGPALSIEPEPIRIISPGHSDNQSGLNAMQQLLPATDSKRHFLVPLPPGLHPESPELFGFFTYEFRVGHRDAWSTAQGRFGRELLCQGVQHPMPAIAGPPDRDEATHPRDGPHAEAVFDGRTRDRPTGAHPTVGSALCPGAHGRRQRQPQHPAGRPADAPGTALRIIDPPVSAGVLVASIPKTSDAPNAPSPNGRNAEISTLLKNYGLPADSELSVLCVEMMPTTEHFLMNREFAEQHQYFARAGRRTRRRRLIFCVLPAQLCKGHADGPANAGRIAGQAAVGRSWVLSVFADFYVGGGAGGVLCGLLRRF